MAEFYTIVAREKELPVAPPKPEDFTVEPAEGSDPARLLAEPGWSPYCFDGTDLWFTRLPDTDLAAVPFVFMSQFDRAEEFAKLSPAELVKITEGLDTPKIAMIYSIGRCGTTLANHVLNASPDVWCLSEPDVFDHVAKLGGDAETHHALARFFHAIRTKPDATVLGIKYRSQSLFCAPALHAAFPQSKNVFMYRDALGWGNSLFAFTAKLGLESPYVIDIIGFMWEMMVREPVADAIARHTEFSGETVEPSVVYALLWQKHLNAYQAARAEGIPMVPIRYNEFNANREEGVRNLFAALGIPEIPADEAMRVFENDSQEGTIMGRVEKPPRLDEAQVALLHKTLADNSPLVSADTILD